MQRDTATAVVGQLTAWGIEAATISRGQHRAGVRVCLPDGREARCLGDQMRWPELLGHVNEVDEHLDLLLGRDSAELTALADHLTAHGIALEMLASPLTGIYDPTGTGRVLFAFFAAMAETERENIREATLEGLNAAARKGHHGGRPPVITDDMLHTVLRRRASGESVESIRPDLIIPAGKRKGHTPSPASIYRAITEHEKRRSYPEAVDQAHADFASPQTSD